MVGQFLIRLYFFTSCMLKDSFLPSIFSLEVINLCICSFDQALICFGQEGVYTVGHPGPKQQVALLSARASRCCPGLMHDQLARCHVHLLAMRPVGGVALASVVLH